MTTRHARLYLDLLKSAVLNELFLDHEVQIFYLFDCLEGRTRFDPAVFSHATIHLKPVYDDGHGHVIMAKEPPPLDMIAPPIEPGLRGGTSVDYGGPVPPTKRDR